MDGAALDSLHSYAAAYRFLNRVLHAAYERTNDLEPFWFISYNGELAEHAGHVSSSDPAYWPSDWSDATGGAETTGPEEAYAALLTFIGDFANRGCEEGFRDCVAGLETGPDRLPRDPALRAWWAEAWAEAACSDIPAVVRMTRTPFIMGRTWRAGEGWID
jgi:hypothetical protein